jgi:hypothetical protein
MLDTRSTRLSRGWAPRRHRAPGARAGTTRWLGHHRMIGNSQPGLITVPGTRAAPVYQAARCLLWMIERRECLGARGVLSVCLRRLPGVSPAMLPPCARFRTIGRLAGVADGVTIAWAGRKRGRHAGSHRRDRAQRAVQHDRAGAARAPGRGIDGDGAGRTAGSGVTRPGKQRRA